jgi:hypothetical protein
MAEIDIKEYAKRLFTKAGEAMPLKRAVIEGGDWKPQPNMCHHNVSIWCQNNPDYKSVRGWLYFDLAGLNFVKFVAHSAVKSSDGELYDITPSNASKDYPFVDSELTEEEYADLVENKGCGEICYFDKNMEA